MNRRARRSQHRPVFIYGKTAANAIAVISYLAADPSRRAGSSEIAKARRISRALTAKLLTRLAAAGLVSGQPGPGGGYQLAVAPGEIRLLDVVSLFEQTAAQDVCPFGHDWCGKGDACPLHDAIAALREEARKFVENTTLAGFEGVLPPAPAQQKKRAARK